MLYPLRSRWRHYRTTPEQHKQRRSMLFHLQIIWRRNILLSSTVQIPSYSHESWTAPRAFSASMQRSSCNYSPLNEDLDGWDLMAYERSPYCVDGIKDHLLIRTCILSVGMLVFGTLDRAEAMFLLKLNGQTKESETDISTVNLLERVHCQCLI